ncbi:AfsR/SARP family transcriptional regulator [Nocardia harenae]|uniref:AfsR/SARP family transcriptional regulator n=1 Tax=Nocardia harenae TaxID=358707 RepID=UPI0008316314|nr:BTAD domain-containing putative transcriptional regulator [Nocardia harenae]
MVPESSGPIGRNQTVAPRDGEPPRAAAGGALLEIGLLGPVAVRGAGALRPLPGARARALLAALALRRGRSRSAAGLIEDVWGAAAPRAPMNALHTQMSRLRSVLPGGAVSAGPAGYRLELGAELVDLSHCALLLEQARAQRGSGAYAACLTTVLAARALWRGEPGADLPPGPLADELRERAAGYADELDALEITGRAGTGDPGGALRLAGHRAAALPLDEPAHVELVRLLAATGRSAAALETVAGFRARLADRLGADPGPELTELNTAVLRGERIAPLAPDLPPATAGLPHIGRPEPGYAAGAARPAPHVRDADPGYAAGAARPAPRPGDLEFGFDTGAARPAALAGLPAEPGSAGADGHAGRAPFLGLGVRAAPNPLLGRAADLAALEELLRTSRVTTVLGPGGTGKTRVAHELGAREIGAVALVELASIRAAEPDVARGEIESAIAAVLGVSEAPFDSSTLRTGPVELRQRLFDAVSARPTLLVLDNCEHLIEAVATLVAEFIAHVPRLRVLTTSRAPLMITAEAVYPLPPLRIDPAGSPATDLFAARARAVRPSVRIDPAVVARLCHTLDGLPLAIELAAARVRTMSVEEIAERLHDRFALLRSGDRSSPARHRTLHAVIDWSWNLLEPGQQVALRRLCRFPAGFTLAAAEVVAAGAEVGEVAAAVDGLVNQSLLTVQDTPAGLRYRMLETVREYGEERLAASGEGEEIITRTLTWARGCCEDLGARAYREDQLILGGELDAEQDNLLAALRWATERADGRTVYTVFPALGVLWMMRGAHGEVIAWTERLLHVPPPAPDDPHPSGDLQVIGTALQILHAGFRDHTELRTLALVRIRTRRLLALRTDISESVVLAARLLVSPPRGTGIPRLVAEAVRSPDRDARVNALILRANIRENLGDLHGSLRDAATTLTLLRPGDGWSLASAHRHIAQLHGQAGRYREAVEPYVRGIGLLERIGAYDELIEARTALVGVLIGCGELERADAELERTMQLADLDPEAPDGTVSGLLGILFQAQAELLFARGRIEEGVRRYRRALAVSGWPGTSHGPGAWVLMLVAATLDAEVLYGDPIEAGKVARELAEAAGRIFHTFQDVPQVGAIACALGSRLIVSGDDPETGLRLLLAAPRLPARQDFPTMLVHRHLALAEAALGPTAIAEAEAALGPARRMRLLRQVLGLIAETTAGAPGEPDTPDAGAAQARRM